MAIQITIIGMGQIGASIGLALAKRPDLIRRIGNDRDLGTARQAEKMGAIDKVVHNLPNSVSEADLVLLALPANEIYETLKIIAPDLKEGAVVMDTAPAKQATAAWAGELLAEGRYYVGLGPVFNPAYIHKVESGVEAARADLFKDGMLVIVSPPRTPSEAIQLAADLAKLLEAGPFFADLVEADSLLAATHTVPQLLAVALLEATVNRPGWREARKVAGSPYAAITSLAQHWEQDAGVQSAVLLNAEHVGRTLDQVIAALEDLRTAITQGDEATLAARLERARLARLAWWSQRQAGNWAEEENRSSVKPPTASEVFGRFIGLGGRKPKPKE